MKNLLMIVAVLCSILLSCKKIEIPKGTPICIKKEIHTISKQPVRNPPAEVWRYQYNGQTVYFIPAYCCDMFSVLYDEKCNVICHPDGGITGGGDGKCTDFFDKRTDGELIWKDDR